MAKKSSVKADGFFAFFRMVCIHKSNPKQKYLILNSYLPLSLKLYLWTDQSYIWLKKRYFAANLWNKYIILAVNTIIYSQN
jgi:hypothetical protein